MVAEVVEVFDGVVTLCRSCCSGWGSGSIWELTPISSPPSSTQVCASSLGVVVGSWFRKPGSLGVLSPSFDVECGSVGIFKSPIVLLSASMVVVVVLVISWLCVCEGVSVVHSDGEEGIIDDGGSR